MVDLQSLVPGVSQVKARRQGTLVLTVVSVNHDTGMVECRRPQNRGGQSGWWRTDDLDAA